MKKPIPAAVHHEEVVTDMLKKDPEFAVEYLKAALDEADTDAEGQAIFLDAVRRITATADGQTTLGRGLIEAMQEVLTHTRGKDNMNTALFKPQTPED